MLDAGPHPAPHPTKVDPEFRRAVLDGLSRPQKAISSEWLYDQRGSELYEDITRQPEYYVARTETAILRECAADIAAKLPSRAAVVEYGAGAALKTRLLLDALDRPRLYAPLDISEDFLLDASERIAEDYPDITVRPIVAHFLAQRRLGEIGEWPRRLGFFPGSTIGNLGNEAIRRFFETCRRQLGEGAQLILGADRAKDPSILRAAYDDAAGVTAAFNKNLLKRINRELGGTFATDDFAHEARWNAEESRMEMHLLCRRNHTVRVLDRKFPFRRGETIHTEISRKFRKNELERLAEQSGWRVDDCWMDGQGYFSILLLRAD